MLIDFTFSNVRSFKDKVTFSMETGEGITAYSKENTIQHDTVDAVKSAFIFGGNASGKTNLLRALMLLRIVVLHGTLSEIDPLPIDTYAHGNDNTYFNIRFIKNDKQFTYTIEYNEDFVVEESLVVDGNILFSRDTEHVHMPESIVSLESSLRRNQPLLYFAQSNNVLLAKEAYEWFALDILSPSLPTSSMDSRKALRALHDNPQLKDDVLYFLRAADFNIRDIKTELVQIPNEQNIDTSKSVLLVKCEHEGINGDTFSIEYEAESIGTRIFLMLALAILQRDNHGKLFLIDEFDRLLHPKLVTILLKIFNEWNTTESQLIATTHDNDILDYALRTDQIWFVDKNYYGISELHSAFDFDELDIREIKKNYQDGVYGGNQIVSDVLMKDIIESV